MSRFAVSASTRDASAVDDLDDAPASTSFVLTASNLVRPVPVAEPAATAVAAGIAKAGHDALSVDAAQLQVSIVLPASVEALVAARGAIGHPKLDEPNTMTQAQLDQLVAGFEQTLTKVESNLVSQVFGDDLPLLGEHLASAAAGGAPALNYLTALKAALNGGLASLAGSPTYTQAQVQQALHGGLDAAGIQNSVNLDLTNPADIKLALTTAKSFAAFDTALDADFGLPGLGLQSSGSAHSAFNYTLNFGVGIDTSGFYLNTANSASLFHAGFTTTVADLGLSANLGNLRFHVTDESAGDGDGVAPTTFAGNFVIDLLDPGSQGADDKLRPGELTAGADLLNATLDARANVNLNLASDLGTAVLPSIGADLNVDWSFSNSVVTAGDANTAFGLVPTVAFRNVKLDLGSFFSDFAGPVLQKVQIVTEPLQPILDALTDDVEALTDLVSSAGLEGLVPTTLLEIMVAAGQVSPEDEARIHLLDNIVSFVNSVPTDGGGVKIDLGDFNLGALDPRAAGFTLSSAVPNEVRHAVDAALQSGALGSFLGDASALPGAGLAFPIIQNPQSAFGLLLGKNVDFFTYDAPDLVAYGGFDEFFRLAGPLGIRLRGEVSAVAKLDFGYDSHGLVDFAANGFTNPSLIFDGFYVVDQDGPEATFDASLEAFLAVNVLLAEAGAGGGITGHAQVELEDPTPGDGRVRVSEIIDGLSDGCLFDLSGKVTAGVSAYLTIGWSPFSHTFTFDGPSAELVNFDGTDCDTAGGDHEPVLARSVGVALSLNIGPDAPLRIRGDNIDTIEFFGVDHVSGAAGNEVVAVSAFSLAPQSFTVGAGGRINANGGVLDDTIVLGAGVLSPALLHGGDGGDHLWGGAGADTLFGDVGMDFLGGRDGDDTLDGGAGYDLLDGMAGNDTLRGGSDADILIGGAGADQLDGGSGDDTASYVTLAAPVLLDLGTPAASTGDAAGDAFVSIEHFYGSDFNDTLRGDAGSNYLAGDKGDDLVEGRDGNDLLIGGAGADRLDGGAGSDYVSYVDGKVAVSVSLATGVGSGGFAQGDVLVSIENLEGVDTAGEPGDTLEGNDADNQIRGLGGADTLLGLGGNDQLAGGIDDDRLDGGSGNDMLAGEQGNDTLAGGAGLDALSGGDGNDRLDGGGDADNLSGDGGDDTLDGGAGDDVLDGGTGADRLVDLGGNNRLLGGDDDDVLAAGAGNDALDGGIGNDSLDAGDGANTLAGGDGNDTLLSGSGADRIDGGIGDDAAGSGAGDDSVAGNDGNDALDAGSGSDRVDGGIGDDLLSVGTMRAATQDPNRLDHLFGGAGFDTLSADFSNQTVAIAVSAGPTQSLVFADGTEARDFENVHDLFTGSGADTLRLDGRADDGFGNLLKTGAGNDVIYAGAGSDDVDAGAGDDLVNGGSNDARLTFELGFGTVTGFTGEAETLAGGDGNDTLSFLGFSGLFPPNIASGRHFGVAINLSTNQTGGAATGITISGFENVIGTDYGDDLVGDDGANVFTPLRGGGYTYSATTSGPDRIDGKGGEDTLRIDFAEVANSLGIVTNAYTIYRNTIGNIDTVDSYIYGNVEHLDITGAGTNDGLYSNVAGFSDILRGMGGNDVLGGNGGADTLLGGDGNDVLTAQGQFAVGYNGPAGGHDVLDGGAGDDLVEDIAFAFSAPQLGADALFQLDGGSGFDTLSADFSNQGVAIAWNSAAPTNLEFADGAYARNFEALRYFASGSGNDSIVQQGRVANLFYLGAGDDTVNPGLGVDSLDGGAGFDTAVLDFSLGDTADMAGVQSGGNADGGSYQRALLADASNRIDNIFLRNFERVQVTGSSKADNISGTYGDDTLIGGDGNDILDGNRGGNNHIEGGNGDDVLKGSYGEGGTGADDTLLGGEGDDRIMPLSGSDTASGGAGNDTITVTDFPPNGYGQDDFDGGEGDDDIADGYFNGATSYATASTRLHLDGGSGVDRLSADFGNQTQAITFVGGAANSATFGDGSYFRGFETLGNFTAGSGDDRITLGGRADNGIAGGAGNDVIDPGVGIDFVFGGAGDDVLVVDYAQGDAANVGGVTFDGTYLQRHDLSTGALVDSVFSSGVEHFHFTGGSKDDQLLGGSSDDALDGGGGNDTLTASGGADTLTGGTGADRFAGTASDLQQDRITDLGLDDTIDVTGLRFGAVRYDATTGVLGLDISGNGSYLLQLNLAAGIVGEFVATASVAGQPASTQVRLMQDSDGDGVGDFHDNAILVPNPDQRDTDGDGYGNVVDADFNQDKIVDFFDLSIFDGVFFTSDANADLNGDGQVDFFDLSILDGLFGKAPGPSYVDDIKPAAPASAEPFPDRSADRFDYALLAAPSPASAPAATHIDAGSLFADHGGGFVAAEQHALLDAGASTEPDMLLIGVHAHLQSDIAW